MLTTFADSRYGIFMCEHMYARVCVCVCVCVCVRACVHACVCACERTGKEEEGTKEKKERKMRKKTVVSRS